MLSTQVAKDPTPQLSKICDIAELVGMLQPLNWRNILKDSRKLGARRMVLYALCLTHKVLGTPLPQEVVVHLSQTSIQDLVEHTSRQFFEGDENTVQTQFIRQRLDSIVRERFRDKAYPYYLRYSPIFIPNDQDRALLPLPSYLDFLYYLLRPFRLFWVYGSRLLEKG